MNTDSLTLQAVKQMLGVVESHDNRIGVMETRVDTLDAANIDGDLRQRLVRMMQRYSRQKGIMLDGATSANHLTPHFTPTWNCSF